MNPPFRRIAVLDLPSIPGRKTFNSKDDHDGEAIIQWLLFAREEGADAVYARIRSLKDEDAQALIRLLGSFPPSLLPQLLVPPGLATPPLWFSGVHFSAAEKMEKTIVKTGIWKGKSCHSAEDVLLAEKTGYDYVFISPVFSTGTHPDVQPLGLEALRRICTAVSIPVYALGGISRENEKMCIEAGAYGIAGIARFLRG